MLLSFLSLKLELAVTGAVVDFGGYAKKEEATRCGLSCLLWALLNKNLSRWYFMLIFWRLRCPGMADLIALWVTVSNFLATSSELVSTSVLTKFYLYR